MRLLRSYILRLHLVPLGLGFGVVTFILVMDVLFDYLDLMVNRGVAPGIVLQLFVLSLGYIVALSVPCAVLVAVLMTFGRLSQDNEITALRASGVHLGSILAGPLAAATLLALGLVAFNNYVLPESNHAFANLLIDIGRMRPTVKLQEGTFVTDFPGYNLLVQSVNGRTNEMRGVTIYQLNAGAPPTTILARRGWLSYTPDGRTALYVRGSELKKGARAITGGWSSRRTSSTSPGPARSWSERCATPAAIASSARAACWTSAIRFRSNMPASARSAGSTGCRCRFRPTPRG